MNLYHWVFEREPVRILHLVPSEGCRGTERTLCRQEFVVGLRAGWLLARNGDKTEHFDHYCIDCLVVLRENR